MGGRRFHARKDCLRKLFHRIRKQTKKPRTKPKQLLITVHCCARFAWCKHQLKMYLVLRNVSFCSFSSRRLVVKSSRMHNRQKWTRSASSWRFSLAFYSADGVASSVTQVSLLWTCAFQNCTWIIASPCAPEGKRTALEYKLAKHKSSAWLQKLPEKMPSVIKMDFTLLHRLLSVCGLGWTCL